MAAARLLPVKEGLARGHHGEPGRAAPGPGAQRHWCPEALVPRGWPRGLARAASSRLENLLREGDKEGKKRCKVPQSKVFIIKRKKRCPNWPPAPACSCSPSRTAPWPELCRTAGHRRARRPGWPAAAPRGPSPACPSPAQASRPTWASVPSPPRSVAV